MSAASISTGLYTGHVPLTATESASAQASIAADLGSRYRLRGYLGRGAFATVWHAQDLIEDRSVAVKRFDPGEAQGRNFYRELVALFRLSHPHIVQAINLLEGASTPGVRYLILEFCAGGSLRAAISRARRAPRAAESAAPLERIAQIAAQLAAGLAEAHRHGLAHRDLKPENILFSEAARADVVQAKTAPADSVPADLVPTLGGDAAVKLADFGLAQLRRNDDRAMRGGHQLGRLSGSPAYMAPEQFIGEAGRPADLYALGVILYELLHLELPFAGSPGELASAHCHEQPRISAGLPRRWRELLAELLSKSAAARPTAEDLLARLPELADGERRVEPVPSRPLRPAVAAAQPSTAGEPRPAPVELALPADVTTLLAVPDSDLFLAVAPDWLHILSVADDGKPHHRSVPIHAGRRARLSANRRLWLADDTGIGVWGQVPSSPTDTLICVEPTMLVVSGGVDDFLPPTADDPEHGLFWLADGKLWSLSGAEWLGREPSSSQPRAAPARTAPARTAPARTAPARTAPARTAPPRTATANPAPPRTATANPAPPRTATANPAPPRTATANPVPPRTELARVVAGLQLPTALAATAEHLVVADRISRPRLVFLDRATAAATVTDAADGDAGVVLALPGPCWELHGGVGARQLLARVLVGQRLLAYTVTPPSRDSRPDCDRNSGRDRSELARSASLLALPDSDSLRAAAVSPRGTPWGVDPEGRVVCWLTLGSSADSVSVRRQIVDQLSVGPAVSPTGRVELAVGPRWWAVLRTIGDGSPGIVSFGRRPRPSR